MTASVRKQRKRKHSDEFRARVLGEVDQPGVMLKTVAEKYNLAPSLIHAWRTQQRQKAAIESEPLGFVHYGEVADISDKGGHGYKARRPTLSVLTPPALAASAAPDAASVEHESVGAPAEAQAYEPPEATGMGSFPAAAQTAEPLDHIVGYPGERPGLIDIHMQQGVRILVDSFVNEKALARALRALKAAA